MNLVSIELDSTADVVVGATKFQIDGVGEGIAHEITGRYTVLVNITEPVTPKPERKSRLGFTPPLYD